MYGFLADLIESNNQHILGSNNSNLPRVIAIIAEAVAVEVLAPDNVAKQRLVNLVNQVKVIHYSSPYRRDSLILAGQRWSLRGLCGWSDGTAEESYSGDYHQLAWMEIVSILGSFKLQS